MVATASSLVAEVGERRRWMFADLGAALVDPSLVQARQAANDDTDAALVHGATVRLPDRRAPAPRLLDDRGHAAPPAIEERWKAGAVVAGTRASASALSTHMIATKPPTTEGLQIERTERRAGLRSPSYRFDRFMERGS